MKQHSHFGLHLGAALSVTLAFTVCATAEPAGPATTQGTAAVAQATPVFDSDFESGNGANFRMIDEDTVAFEIEPDTNARDRQWYYFTVSGAQGRTLTFRIDNVENTNVRSHWRHHRPVYSTDGGTTWQRVEGEAQRVEDDFFFTHTIETERDHIAFHHPYTWTMMKEKFKEWEGAEHLERETIGHSVEGRPIVLYRLTDASVPDDEKIGIWVLSRQHSGETTASFSIEAFMDFALSDHPEAQALRAGTLLNIVPMVNPDGVIAGNYRQNIKGVNLNRVWNGSANEDDSPEVYAIVQQIEHWIEQGHDYSMFIDFHATAMGAAPHFAFHPGMGATAPLYQDPAAYHDDLRRYLEFVEAFAPHFDPERGETLSDNPALAYHSQRLYHGVLAMTPEGTYNRVNRGPDANDYLSDEHHRSVGTAFARAIVAYYGLMEEQEAEGE